MKELVKNIWVEALRSGKFKQGQKRLQTLTGDLCCLGVLCEISGLGKFENTEFQGQDHHLPFSVRKWADMSSINGKYADAQSSLAVDNDRGKTFPEIADIIEANWREL